MRGRLPSDRRRSSPRRIIPHRWGRIQWPERVPRFPRQRSLSRGSAGTLPPALDAPHLWSIVNSFATLDVEVTRWMARHGPRLLRISLGIVFLWFGALKFFPGLSPAQDLAGRTIEVLTLGIVKPKLSLPVLAAWECIIGIGLITGMWMRATILLLMLQMIGTLTPVVLFPGEVFLKPPYAPTLEGQYIIKNLVLMSAAIVLGALVRGGAVDPEPRATIPP